MSLYIESQLKLTCVLVKSYYFKHPYTKVTRNFCLWKF